MTDVKKLITEHLDIWLTAKNEKKSGRGRSSGSNDSIYGIQKLRELILDLAVVGKLTKQNFNDSNVESALKDTLNIKSLKLSSKKTKNKKNINLDLSNNNIPLNWRQTYLENLVEVLNGRAYKKNELLEAGTPVLRVGNLFTSDHWYYSDLQLEDDKYCDNGDLLFAWSASFGPVIWQGPKVIYHYHIWKLNFFSETAIHKQYLYLYLLQQTKSIKNAGHGVMLVHLTKEKMEKLVINIPPLEEQQRIVAKVDELMQLCDQLEQQQNLSSEAHDQLVDTLLNVLINSSDVDEFQQNWQYISENFDLLFTTEYSIGQLKQTILQLAVMGRLVKQDPKDEPASQLLKQITKEKSKLVKEGKIKKSKPLPEITDDEKPFELPSGWEYSRLLGFVDLKGGFAYKSELFIENSKNQVVRMGNVRPDLLRLDEKAVFITDSLAAETVDSELIENDIIITMTGTRGKKDYLYTTLVKADHLRDKKLFLNQRLTTIRVNQQLIDARYLNIVFKVDQILEPLFDSATGTANQANVGMLALGNLLVPLCSISEQKRIVEKVVQLFSLIEKLQELRSKLQRTKLHLADSLIASALNDSTDKSESEGTDNIIQFEKPIEAIKQSNQKVADQIDLFTDESVDDVKLLSLAAEITFQLHTESTFGHLKLQKLIYLCQQLKHMDLAADFKQHAAGPYDPVMARYLDKEFKDREWFNYDPKRDLKYKPLSRCNDHRSAFNRYFAKDVSEIYDLIGLFRTSKSDHIEIVATLFACWLRLLEKNRSVSEEQLLKDFYAWSEEKKRFSKDEVLNGYKWMKQNSVVPVQH
ncbi:restriction endonuclease subunit S [Acinetobacter sp. ANC 3882]|uniref:restriction endonuclease subunit S n=1 Tax=Acinetobacter sp. ANC 3882 TaxID=2923423 RepID=UPI001F4BA433|nr:restriction endonuclease subunit S [Acinetobacter sp. ANC 3882]MCH7315268.1 restriction endonuclease subunit S [Acinetobacter sp. ANC 3882]